MLENCPRSSGRRDCPQVSIIPGEFGSPMNLGMHYAASPNIENNTSEPRNIQNTARGILAPKSCDDRRSRRNLRPRIERSYAESPDEPRLNGYVNGNASDSEEGLQSLFISKTTHLPQFIVIFFFQLLLFFR